MKEIPSAYEYQNDPELLWEYTNSIGDVMRVGRSLIKIECNNEVVIIPSTDIISLELSKNWKHVTSERTINIHWNGTIYRFIVDTTRGKFMDIVTVFRQLCRTLRSNGADFIEC
jgi:hypothetical protein